MTDSFAQVFLDLLKSKYDNTPTKDESYASQLMGVHQEFVKRNCQLTGLLKDYIDYKNQRFKENKICKRIIFGVFIAFFVLLSIIVAVVFIRVDYNKVSINTAVSLVTVAGTYLGSILSIIKIISEYLFPVDEEKNTIEMIKTVIENDVNVENMMSQAIAKTESIDVETIRECKKMFDENCISKEEYEELKKRLIRCKND